MFSLPKPPPVLPPSPTPLSRSPCFLLHWENWGHQSRTPSISSPATNKLICLAPSFPPSLLSQWKGCPSSYVRLILPPRPSIPSPSLLRDLAPSVFLSLPRIFLPLSTGSQHPNNMNSCPPSWKTPPPSCFPLELLLYFSSFLSSQSSRKVVCSLSSLPSHMASSSAHQGSGPQ